jgi:hypothetical protein
MMTLPAAIAHSSGNKACAHNDNLELIIVQERYSARSTHWLHVWRMDVSGTRVMGEDDLNMDKVDMQYLHSAYDVDPDRDIWEAL